MDNEVATHMMKNLKQIDQLNRQTAHKVRAKDLRMNRSHRIRQNNMIITNVARQVVA